MQEKVQKTTKKRVKSGVVKREEGKSFMNFKGRKEKKVIKNSFMTGHYCKTCARNRRMTKISVNDTHIMKIRTNCRIQDIAIFHNFSCSGRCFR